jgi:D-lactate dehydrogenase (cytochrome)
MALRPGAKGMATDVCVPISKLAECILETRRDIDEQKLLSPIVGHVGDGNFHCCFIMDPDDPEEMARVNGVNKRMVMRALAMGGTCTGEHGVGIGKIEYLEAEHGEALSVMRSMKIALDPNNIMNPGKIINL